MMSPTKHSKTEQTERPVGLWRKLLKCYKGLEREIGARFKSNYGQSLSRFDVLEQLSANKDKWMTVGDLSSRLLDSPSGISALMTRMEDQDLLVRRLNPDDRRSWQVSITPSGRSLHKKMSKDYTAWVSSMLEEFSDDEREILSGLADRLSTAEIMSTGSNKK